jgi:hypothetical protein
MSLIDESFSANEVYPSENKRNKKREASFSFYVEKDKKPELKYKLKDKCKSPKEILKNFFHPDSSYAQGKKFEILNYSFETGEEKFYEAGDCPFIEAYRIAYLHHFPIVINPNIFWLIILQGFSKHMEIKDNAERNRYKFVNFEGREDIIIRTDLNLFRASDDQWQVIIEKLMKETLKKININKNILNVFKKKFSTSTREEEVAITVTFLSIFKKYFKYSIDGTCGISKITIEGTIEDWELLLNKIIEIGNLDEEIIFWTDEIKKIVQKIINTLKTRKPDINFFKNMVQNTDRSKECQPDIINGWIVKFIPYDKNNNKCNFNSPEFNGLTIEQIPSQIVILPFNLINVLQKYDAEIYTGFVGFSQDEKTLAIKPIIGYIIVKVEKKENDPNEKIRKLEQEIEKLKLNQRQNSNFNENMIYPQNYNY